MLMIMDMSSYILLFRWKDASGICISLQLCSEHLNKASVNVGDYIYLLYAR